MAPPRPPDFVIAGAMKCGTTWLHDVLSSVPGVQIPRDEVHLFDAHDPLTHPDFQSLSKAGLRLCSSQDTPWHTDRSEAELYGYDSSTLFHSHIDFGRLARDYPRTKYVVLLRDPTERAYSHYWHLVRTARARFGFEKQLLFGREEILQRSIYLDGARRIRGALKDRVLFVLYESLFESPDTSARRIGEYLGLDECKLKNMAKLTARRSNPGRFPRWLRGWLACTRLMPVGPQARYAQTVGKSRNSIRAAVRYRGYRLGLACAAFVSGGITTQKPPMNSATAQALDAFFREANSGLDDILDQDTSKWWYRSVR